MPVNPYESPLTEPMASVAPAAPRPTPIPVSSVIAVIAAGIAGGSAFIGLGLFSAVYIELGARIFVGSAAALFVLLAAHRQVHRRWPEVAITLFGMLGILLASPLAFTIAFQLCGIGYGMGTKGIPGGWVYFGLGFYSFFFIISLGGWIALYLAHSKGVPRLRLWERLPRSDHPLE